MCFADSEVILGALRDKPLVAIWLDLLFVLVVALGAIHTSRVFLECLLVVIRHFKYELIELASSICRLKHEFMVWRRRD